MGDEGHPPKTGWAKGVCELLVEDISISLDFWQGVLGFEIAYQRREAKFAYLERPEGAQVMLCQRWGGWETAALDVPFGRGILMQFYIEGLDEVAAQIAAHGWPIHTGPREVWRRWGDIEGGAREIIVQDPDGYLVMMAENIGTRPLVEAS